MKPFANLNHYTKKKPAIYYINPVPSTFTSTIFYTSWKKSKCRIWLFPFSGNCALFQIFILNWNESLKHFLNAFWDFQHVLKSRKNNQKCAQLALIAKYCLNRKPDDKSRSLWNFTQHNKFSLQPKHVSVQKIIFELQNFENSIFRENLELPFPATLGVLIVLSNINIRVFFSFLSKLFRHLFLLFPIYFALIIFFQPYFF